MVENQQQESGAVQSKKGPSWKKVLFLLIIFVFGLAGVSTFFEDSILTPIEGQLKAIKENRISESYYNYMTHEFQEQNSLVRFKEFLQSHPVLQQPKEFVYETSEMTDGLATLKGKIVGSNGKEFIIQYTLKKDHSGWKIGGIQLSEAMLSPPSAQLEEKMDRSIIEPIEAQLNALKRKNINAAYDDVVSSEFRRNTTLNEFKKFIERYPVFSDYSKIVYKSQSIHSQEANVLVELIDHKQSYEVNYKLILDGSRWKIWNMRLSTPIADQSDQLSLNLMTIKKPIIDQLKAIQRGDLKAAYHKSVTEEFMSATPYVDFEDFVKNFSILKEHESMEIGDLAMDDDGVGVLEVDFYSRTGMTSIEYTLAQEKGNWKILGIKVLQHKQFDQFASNSTNKSRQNQSSFDFNKDALVKIILSQIDAVKSGQYSDAYYQYTSNAFQEATSLAVFENFMKRHPAYSNNIGGKFAKLSLNNNVATVTGALLTRNGSAYPVEYDMVLEEGKWKVLHVEIRPAVTDVAIRDEISEEKAMEGPIFAGPLKISNIDIGSSIGGDGIVDKPTNVITSIKDNIYVNVKIENAKKDVIVELYLKHLDSGEQVQPVSTSINANGKSVVTFVYTPPAKGWPMGQYELLAKTSVGGEFAYRFQIKKPDHKD